MLFSSLLFLFFFLPITLFVYFISPRILKNMVLLIVSFIFYAWGEPVYILLMIFSAIVDYVHGLLIYNYRQTHQIRAKLFLISSLVINLGLLSFFKYADFLVANLNGLLGTGIAPLDLPLPIGISFYTFQTMSYSIDVYRGRFLPQKNPLDFAMYVSFFPQLIAGPIVRYEDMAENMKKRGWNTAQFSEGVKIFIIGLGKKVLLANNIGLLWSQIQTQDQNDLTVLAAWLGIIAFAFQLYFDFSGYSDMAVGLGKMFGFDFPRNFHYPYIAKSVTEFWRRWHMTLSRWFRDYVYFPLGGSKKGTYITYRNLLTVWGLTGLWHGASWNFVLWGIYFGLLISIEKAGWLNILRTLHPFFQHVYLIFCILIGWVLFIFEDYTLALGYLKVMFGLEGNAVFDSRFVYYFYTNVILLIMVGIGSTPAATFIKNEKMRTIMPLIYLIILGLSTAYLVDDSYNPFLYFRF